MANELFDREINLSRNNGGKCEELSVVIDQLHETPYFVIRFTDKNGWRCEKQFWDNKTAQAAWDELKRLDAVKMA